MRSSTPPGTRSSTGTAAPGAVDDTPPLRGPRGPRVGRDRVRDRRGRSIARDPDEDAPGDHPFESEHAAGDRIDSAEIVQEPAIDPGRCDGGLEVGKRFR